MDTGPSGKSVIVTGRNANIVRGIVLAFAAQEAKIAIAGRDAAQGLYIERGCVL